MLHNIQRLFTLILLFFLAINAFYGGWLLIAFPSGDALQIPVEMLQGTPFSDYLIPGIILLLANGVFGLLVAFMTIFRKEHYPLFIIIQGCILIGWLTIKLLINTEFFAPILHLPLYAIGIFFILSGTMIKRWDPDTNQD